MPINFTCPHCGTTTNVADEYPGQTGPCVRCGNSITVPRPQGTSPFGDMPQLAARVMRLGLTILVAIAVALGVITALGILVALLLPAVAPGHTEATRRAQCANNLKQISLALLNYESANGRFPPAFVADKDGKPMHSWRVLILPYMELGPLYNQYHFDEPWNSPHNRELATKIPSSIYRCPSDASADQTNTSYAMLVGPHAFSDGPNGRRIGDIKDGLSNTITVVECADSDINWMEPRDIDAEKMPLAILHPSDSTPPPDPGISSFHAMSANVAICDGSVRSLSNDVNSKVLRALTTIDGGEDVPADY